MASIGPADAQGGGLDRPGFGGSPPGRMFGFMIETSRTARARTSGENLFVVVPVIDPTSHELGSPAKPPRFSSGGE